MTRINGDFSSASSDFLEAVDVSSEFTTYTSATIKPVNLAHSYNPAYIFAASQASSISKLSSFSTVSEVTSDIVWQIDTGTTVDRTYSLAPVTAVLTSLEVTVNGEAEVFPLDL